MLKYWNIVLILVLFIIIIIRMMRVDNRIEISNSKIMHTNIIFSGLIYDIKASNNHNFGVVFVTTSKSSVKDFYKEVPNGEFPFRINSKKAEVYTLIPGGVDVGDSILIESNKETIYYYNKLGEKKTEEYLFPINNPLDVKFVQDNSRFGNLK